MFNFVLLFELPVGKTWLSRLVKHGRLLLTVEWKTPDITTNMNYNILKIN